MLEKAKARMTAVLDKQALDAKLKQLEAAKKKILAKKPVVKVNALLAVNSLKKPKKKIVVPNKKVFKKPIVKRVAKPSPAAKTAPTVSSSIAKRLAQKLAQKIKVKSKAVNAPAPFLDGAPPSSAQLVSVSSNETADQEI